MNDPVSKFAYYIENSIRNNCCSPHTRKWTIKKNALIINNDTIFIEKYSEDTLFVRQMIFDTIRHLKLVRNREVVASMGELIYKVAPDATVILYGIIVNALLLKNGITTQTHAGTNQMLGLHFV